MGYGRRRAETMRLRWTPAVVSMLVAGCYPNEKTYEAARELPPVVAITGAIVLIVVGLYLGSVPGRIAKRNGHAYAETIRLLGLAGMFLTFGIVWLFALLWAKPSLIGLPAAPSRERRVCPFCAEPIAAAAIKCKHCGSDVTVTPVKAESSDSPGHVISPESMKATWSRAADLRTGTDAAIDDVVMLDRPVRREPQVGADMRAEADSSGSGQRKRLGIALAVLALGVIGGGAWHYGHRKAATKATPATQSASTLAQNSQGPRPVSVPPGATLMFKHSEAPYSDVADAETGTETTTGRWFQAAASAVASSTMTAGKRYSYGAENLFDGDLATSWQPRRDDPHPWVRVTFSAPLVVDGLRIANGFQISDNDGDEFLLNSRVAKATVTFDDGTRLPLDFQLDQRGYASFKVPTITTKTMTFSIDAVTPGTRWKDLAISEVGVVGHEIDAPDPAVPPSAPAEDSPAASPLVIKAARGGRVTCHEWFNMSPSAQADAARSVAGQVHSDYQRDHHRTIDPFEPRDYVDLAELFTTLCKGGSSDDLYTVGMMTAATAFPDP